jgi:hypothetical protein
MVTRRTSSRTRGTLRNVEAISAVLTAEHRLQFDAAVAEELKRVKLHSILVLVHGSLSSVALPSVIAFL